MDWIHDKVIKDSDKLIPTILDDYLMGLLFDLFFNLWLPLSGHTESQNWHFCSRPSAWDFS